MSETAGTIAAALPTPGADAAAPPQPGTDATVPPQPGTSAAAPPQPGMDEAQTAAPSAAQTAAVLPQPDIAPPPAAPAAPAVPERRSARPPKANARLAGTVSWNKVNMAKLERSGRPQPQGGRSSTSSAASPKEGSIPGPRQVAVATGDRCKVAHTYNRRSELPEELQDSEEARGVWRAAQQASEGVPHQEANGWLIKYRMRASATSKLGDLYLHPPPDERGVTSKVVRSMSALHDVLLLRHEARVMGAAWQPPRQGHYVELLVEMQGAVPPPPETWLQCDGCGKWRHLPSTMVAAEQPELRWECSLNPEARYSTCEAEQQYSDDEIDRRLAQAPPGEAWRRATVRRVALDLGGRFQVSLSLPSESGAGGAGGVGGLGDDGATLVYLNYQVKARAAT